MKPTILNRALHRPTGGKPESEGPWAAVERLFETVFSRIEAVEKAPQARDGRDGMPGQPGRDGVAVSAARIDDEGRLKFKVGEVEIDAGVARGPDGRAGKDGESIKGPDGKPGVGIEVALLTDGHLVIQLTNGQNLDLGMVRGADGRSGKDGESVRGEAGPSGRGIADAIIDLAGSLVLHFTDGSTKPVGSVVGRDGVDGKDGESIRGEAGRDGKDGSPGRSIVSGKIVDGCLVLTFTDGNAENVGAVVGPEGRSGRDGKDGEDGKPGIDGKAGQSIKGETGQSGKDGKPGRDGKDAPPIAAASVEIGDVFRANISAKDIDRLMVRELTINGETFQVLVPN